MPFFNDPDEAPDPLTRLILIAVPADRFGRKTLTNAARKLNVSKWGLRKWINAQKIPPERALDLVEISEGRIVIEQLHPFVYKP